MSATLAESTDAYVLDAQIGFVLRQAYQRHSVVFAEMMGDAVTNTQWAALAKLREVGDCSQNRLGRLIGMDVATIKGVVERLVKRGYVQASPDLADRRRLVLSVTGEGSGTSSENVMYLASSAMEKSISACVARSAGFTCGLSSP